MNDFDKAASVPNLRSCPSDGHKLPSIFHSDPSMNTLRTFTTGVEGNFHSLSTLAKSAQTRSFHPDLLGTGRQSLSAA